MGYELQRASALCVQVKAVQLNSSCRRELRHERPWYPLLAHGGGGGTVALGLTVHMRSVAGISCQGHPLFSLLPVEPLSSLWPRRLGLESWPSSCPTAGWRCGRAPLSHGPVRLEPTAFWAVKELSKKPASLSFFKKWGWGAGRALCFFLVFSLSTYKLCLDKNAAEMVNVPFPTQCLTDPISCHRHGFLLSWLWQPRAPTAPGAGTDQACPPVP